MAKVVTEVVTKKNITLWSNAVNELTDSSLKFIRKSFQQLLPTAANLVRWKRITDPVCHLCNNGQLQTNKHVLSNCNSAPALTRYTRRHNFVLEKIAEWILETKSSYRIVFADVELSGHGARSMGELFEVRTLRSSGPSCYGNSTVSVLELTVCHETNLLKTYAVQTG